MSLSEQPLVTICVPVYNGEKYLEECLDSILQQTYSNWECIVNNNCSQDKSLEIALQYQKTDNRFKVYTNDHFVGLVQNWNKAFYYANKNARYFKMVQADDWIYPDCIEKMTGLLESNPSIGLCSSYRIDSTIVYPNNYNIYDGKVFDGKEMLIRHLLLKFNLIGSITTIMFSMEYLKKLERFPVIFDENSYHIDTELDYEMMYRFNVGFIPQILSYTRRHSESGTSTVVFKNGTLYQHYEKVLFEYRHLSSEVNSRYKKIRREYAYFYFTKRITGQKKVIDWHKQYMVREFTAREVLVSILLLNPVVKYSKKIVKIIMQHLPFHKRTQ